MSRGQVQQSPGYPTAIFMLTKNSVRLKGQRGDKLVVRPDHPEADYRVILCRFLSMADLRRAIKNGEISLNCSDPGMAVPGQRATRAAGGKKRGKARPSR